MRHNGIKLPPASLAHDNYGVGLCLCSQYVTAAALIGCDQCSTYIMLGLHAHVCMYHCGWPTVCISKYLADNYFDCGNNKVVGLWAVRQCSFVPKSRRTSCFHPHGISDKQ